ncbi:hypothetical protein [Herbiconiux daphne]|uniref:Transcriptional regulator n=1 Tax=Herbiconiux daphne TaxID=2970914 RepID=A0ABT2HA13_9MICO|nr:hypothetical protein [Herbiconiux daphne]MCS5736769.1 hypothetical protein [Herbiconiux daphne]
MITPNEEPIKNIIREAFLNHTNRDSSLSEISEELLVSRQKAKQLFFAFLWNADENLLTRMTIEDEPVWVP